MDDTFASIVPLAFLSDNDLSDEEIEDIAEDEEEDFYDFIPFQQEFLMPLRDRAFSWDVSLEDGMGMHGENFHHAPSMTMENGNPKLVIKAKRMSVTVKTESGTSVVIKSEKEIRAVADNKKNGSSKSGGGQSKKNGKNENDSLASKTDSPPSKNGSSSSSSTALPMKPPTKPPSHSNSSANLRNNSISSTGSLTSVKIEPGIAMDHHTEFSDGSRHPSIDIGSYLADFNEVTDQTFDHSVRSLERLLMPDGVRGSMDSTTSSNGDSTQNVGAQSVNEGPSDGFMSTNINNNNTSSGIVTNNGSGVSSNSSSISIKPPGSLAPITGVHSHSLIGASPGGGSGLVDGSGYASSSGGTGMLGGQQTPSSLLSKGVPSTGLVGYSPGGMTNPDGTPVMKSTPLSSVHQHSTNPYSPYTPAVGGVNGLGVVGSSGACGLLGSSSGPGIAGLGNATGMLGLNVGGLHTNTIMPSNNPNGEYRVGAYTREERQMKIEMFRAKKRKRIWRKQIKYDCRKRLADTRPRVKGRFVSRKLGDNDDIAALMGGMIDEEMEGGMMGGMGGVGGPGGMMDPTGMMMLGGPGAGMMMMGHPGGGGRGAGGLSGGGSTGKSKKQLKNEMQAMQIQQRYAAAVYGAAAGDPSGMMFMGVPGDPSQQMMYHMDYMNAGAPGGMLGMMSTGAGGDMSNPQLQGLLNFNGAAFSPAGMAGSGVGGGVAGGDQAGGLFLSTEQMLLKQQQQMMHTQHMLQQQQIYRESLNLGASPFPNGLSSSGGGGNLLLSPTSNATAAAAAAANSSYLNSLSVSGLNNSGLVGVGASIASEGLLGSNLPLSGGGMQASSMPDGLVATGVVKLEPADASTLDGSVLITSAATATTAPSLSAEGVVSVDAPAPPSADGAQ